MAQTPIVEIGGFKVHEVMRANFQRDFFTQGQGFPITVTKVTEEDKAPFYRASTMNGVMFKDGPSEEEAARALRAALEQQAIKGEL